jgi:hypothetical protein
MYLVLPHAGNMEDAPRGVGSLELCGENPNYLYRALELSFTWFFSLRPISNLFLGRGTLSNHGEDEDQRGQPCH